MAEPATDSGNNNTPENLTCESCFKSYQRRTYLSQPPSSPLAHATIIYSLVCLHSDHVCTGDLLMRHRRRCQGPTNPPTRRKACNACVQAKTKCCYSQPTCSRCAKRGQPCVYVTSNSVSTDSISDLFDHSDGSPASDIRAALVPGSKSGTAAAEPLQLLWDSPLSSWPMDMFDMPLPTTTQPTVSLPALIPADPPNGTTATGRSFLDAGINNDLQSRSGTAVSNPSSSWSNPFPMSIAQPTNDVLAPLAIPAFTPSPPNLTSSPAPTLDPVRILGEYPGSLLKEESTAPFLHWKLYSDEVPDMASLPLTSMAICCGSSVNIKQSARFARRFMDAERQRLIEAFVSISRKSISYASLIVLQPSYQCVQQWDALHAMLLYEVLELRESFGDELETWKHKSKLKGLRSPFLLKVWLHYVFHSRYSQADTHPPDDSVLRQVLSRNFKFRHQGFLRPKFSSNLYRSHSMGSMEDYGNGEKNHIFCQHCELLYKPQQYYRETTTVL